MEKRIKVMDCTLRDGGLALEDAKLSSASNLKFSKADIDEITLWLCDSNIDIIELGSIEISDDNKRGMAIYQNLESVTKPGNPNQLYAALYRGPDTPISDIPAYRDSFCDILRVILRYSELEKSLDFCKALAKKNYKVCIQPMLTMRYTAEEIQLIIDTANDISAYALYYVDTYGYMLERDVTHLFQQYDNGLDDSIKIGFHAHNNMNLAFSNVLSFIQRESDRKIIVDSCLLGMGQGAGNLQTEIIANHMNKHYECSYNYEAILMACEVVEKYYGTNLWGYSLTRLLPAINNTAYKLSLALRNEYKLSFVEVYRILKDIPEQYRHRYTRNSTKELLTMFGYKDLVK